MDLTFFIGFSVFVFLWTLMRISALCSDSVELLDGSHGHLCAPGDFVNGQECSARVAKFYLDGSEVVLF